MINTAHKIFILLFSIWRVTGDHHCKVPNGRHGHTSVVMLDVYLCKKSTRNEDPDCISKPSSTAPLVKGKKTYLLQLNDAPLMVIFYGEDICVSWRYRWQLQSAGRADRNRYSCDSICFPHYQADKVITQEVMGKNSMYHFETKCFNPSTCRLTYHKLGFIVRYTRTPSCPIPIGKIGPKERISLITWICVTTNSRTSCKNHKRSTTVLRNRGKEKNLQMKANGVSVMAQFFGRETCVSYLYRHHVNSDSYYMCDHMCSNLTSEELETYHYHQFCSYDNCGGRHHRLKLMADEVFKLQYGSSGYKESHHLCLILLCLAVLLLWQNY